MTVLFCKATPELHGALANAPKLLRLGLPRVPSLAALVSSSKDDTEARRAFDLRALRCIGDFHGRVDAAPIGLARLVHADVREEKEFGNDPGGHHGTPPSSEAVVSFAEIAAISRTEIA
jgi:hypothetical protein